MASKKPFLINDAKRWLRRYLLLQRRLISLERQNVWSRSIASHVISSSFFKDAKVVAIYASFGSEVLTDRIIEAAWRKGKKVLIPITRKGFDRPYFALYRSGERLQPTAFGPSELHGPSVPFKASSIDLVLVPGLGFDDDGHRIGFGGGVYDRLLQKTPKARHVGLFFSDQRLHKVPRGFYDQQLDALATERGIANRSH